MERVDNGKGEAAGTHPKNKAELFTLASTRLLGALVSDPSFPLEGKFYKPA